jgi:hypothetical protein
MNTNTTIKSTNVKLSNLESSLKDAGKLREELKAYEGNITLLALSLAREIVAHTKWTDGGYAPSYGRLMTDMLNYKETIDVLARFGNQWLPNRIAIVKEGRHVVRFDIKEKRADFLYPSTIGVDVDSMILAINDGIETTRRAIQLEQDAIKEDRSQIAKARKAGKELAQTQEQQDIINKATVRITNEKAQAEIALTEAQAQQNSQAILIARLMFERDIKPSNDTVKALEEKVASQKAYIATLLGERQALKIAA